MTAVLSFLISLLLIFNTLGLANAPGARDFFAQSGISADGIGTAVAGAVRSGSFDGSAPEKNNYEKKVFFDDTGDDFVLSPETVLETEAWLANELTFVSEKSYSDPFNEVELSLVLVGNGVKYTVPGFWNGGNEFKIRFVCPEEGEWLFKTVCSDESNTSLNGRTGRVICSPYSGELDIYRHGFITCAANEKYLTYDDGTPFFWLGDTHWSLGDETQDMVKTITAKRASQGFTVIQSEPIGAGFDMTNGITEEDMPGFADYDAKFKTIADAGLVHANAEFFFPSYMQGLIDCFGGWVETADGRELAPTVKTYLEKISRYWVARYGAYPVVWTLGQEVDNDFYADGNPQYSWNSENNPYKLVAEYIDKYDAYSHPLTAHQENSGSTAAYGSGEGCAEKCKVYQKNAKPSAFRDVKAHGLYAAQWSPSLTKGSDCKVEKDYWFNSQGKPVINYEGRYCMLWTKDFGSRMQGWASFLSGMYGYGWGAHDTWSYLNTYDEQNDSSDGIDTITSAEKINATWQDALEYPCSYQVGYMKAFFENMSWWELIPRFDNSLYFAKAPGVKYYAASNADNSEMVIYFYNFSDEAIGAKPNSNSLEGKLTGRIGSLEPNTEYHCKWFNPVTGEYSEEGTFTSTALGTYSIGTKAAQDTVFYMYK